MSIATKSNIKSVKTSTVVKKDTKKLAKSKPVSNTIKTFKSTKKPITKIEFVKLVANEFKNEISNETARKVISRVFEIISEKVFNENNKIMIKGFGTFETRETQKTTKTHFKTKNKIQIAARKKLKFKPSKVLTEII